MNGDSKNETYRVLKRYADAWAASDIATVMNCYHDEIVFHY
jgi:ketosteroid isomerase-like protein